MLSLYEIEPAYIQYLSTFEPHLFRNKKVTQSFSRKYVGIVLKINGFDYFAPLSLCTQVNIAALQDIHYRNLVRTEYRIIRQKSELIMRNAKAVYDHKMTNDGKSKLSQRCNDFKLLEEKCREYQVR